MIPDLLPAGSIFSCDYMCLIVTMKSLGNSSKDNICIQPDSHDDTSVIDSNVLFIYDYHAV